jgi:predicted Zn finger-like uncharacterized protein
MLIVCPNCATSYMIDQAAVGPAGRTVRCARCRASWFAGGPEPAPDVSVVAETVTAEVQTRRAAGRAESPPTAATAAHSTDADRATPSGSAAATGVKSPPIKPPPPPEPSVPAATTPSEPAAQPAEAQTIESEPVTIADAPPLVPPLEHEPDAADRDTEAEAAASFDARRKRMQARRKQSRRSSRWTAVILVLIAVNVTLIGARNEVVRYLPQTASLFAAIGLPVNLRNLKFENVRLSAETADGVSLLIVQGSIVGETGKPVAVPRLRFALRNASGQEVYSWTMAPPRSILEPGERLQFRSQIPMPQVDAIDVMVRFLTPQDAGGK